MNHSYRLVWNRALRVCQVASELTRSSRAAAGARRRPSALPRRRLAAACAIALLASAAPARAVADGSSCVAGSTQIVIAGTDTAACALADGQSVTIAPSGTLDAGNSAGIQAQGDIDVGRIDIQGTLTDAVRGIMIDGGATVTGGIANTGTLVARGHGIEIGTSAASTVRADADGNAIYNSGSITSTVTGWGNESGISIWKGSQIDGDIRNTATGQIVGYQRGINIDTQQTVVTGNIINDGYISGNGYGLYNAGQIDGAVVSTGTIGNGSGYAIYNTGTVAGGILNSGLLAGNVQLGTTSLELGVGSRVTGRIDGAGASSVTVDGAFTAAAGANVGSIAVSATGNLAIGDGIAWLANSGDIAGTVALSGGELGGNVSVAGGGTLSGHGSIGGGLALEAGSRIVFDFAAQATAGNGQSSDIAVGGGLTLGSAVVGLAGAINLQPGVYNLLTYTGQLVANGGLTLDGSLGSDYAIQVLADSRQVNLIDSAGQALSIWNADHQASSSRMGGGSGTWSVVSATWTNASGSTTNAMDPQPGFAIFGGAAGTVTVADGPGAVQATGLQFASDGYALADGTLTLVADPAYPGPAVVRVGNGSAVGAGWTATIDTTLAGSAGLAKTDQGTLVLGGANTYTGGTYVEGGTLSVATDANLGAAAGGLTLDGGVLQVTGTAFQSTSRNITLGELGGGFDIAAANNAFTVAQALSGDGALVKRGAGTLVLTGANRYSGGTTIAAGTLKGDAASLQGDIVDNASLVFDQAAAGTYTGAISGSGSLTKLGVGALTLTGSNSYAGGTTLSAGTLIGDSDSLKGNILDNAALVVDQADGGIFAATISGSGSLTKQGAGFLTLTRSNSYSGGTVIKGGTLSINSDAALGAAGGGLTLDGGTLQIASPLLSSIDRPIALGDAGGGLDVLSGTFTVSQALSGSGSLTKYGLGTLLLTGANRYSGGTIVGSGTLQGDTTSLQGDITDNAVLLFDQDDDGSFAGDVSGTGSLYKSGTGALTLAGSNSYSGGTTIATGTLQGDAASIQGNVVDLASLAFDQAGTGTFTGSVSGSGSVAKLGSGTLILDGANSYTGGTLVDAGTLQGDAASLQGRITDNAALVFDQGGTGTYAGAISGSGSLATQGTGRLVFNGDSSGFAGDTTVRQGALIVGDDDHAGAALGSHVRVADGATLGGHGTLGGDVDLDSGAHLSPGGSLGTLTVDGDLAIAQGGQLDFEFGTSAAGSLATAGQSDNVRVNGNLALAGVALNVQADAGFGPGLYNLFSYGGTLTTTHGDIAFGTTPGGSYSLQYLADSKQINLLVSDGSTLQFWNANGLASAGRLGGGSGTWSLTSPNWADAEGTPSTPVQPVPGVAIFGGEAGTVKVDGGAGPIHTAGLQFASDGYAMAGDVLTLVATAGRPAPVAIEVGDGSAASAGWTATVGNVLAGSDGLAKTGAGTLVLAGANTYTGGTTVAAGTLSVSSDANLGEASGNLTLDGGTLQVTGTAFRGTARTLALGAAGGGFDIADADNVFTVASPLTGAGALVKAGAGTLVLAGANAYTGGTTVAAGTLQGDSDSLQGDIADHATVAFEQAGDGVFAGTLSGDGHLLKLGAGSLTLDGANAFAGSTEVAAGSLIVGDDDHPGASLAGAVAVDAGATLGGNGTIGGLDLAGTVAPGHSIGTLTVAGDAIFRAGSRYLVEVAPDGSSDLIAVNGTATLLGGSALALGTGEGWAPLTRYTILTATGGIEGRFDSVASSLAFLDPRLSYGADAVQLTLERNDVAFAAAADTRNQRATAGALDGMGTGPLYDAIVTLDRAQARSAFDQLSGEIHASARTAALDDGRYVRDAVNRHLLGEDGGDRVDTDHGSVWSSAWGHWGARDGDGNAARLQANGSGLLVGADTRLDGDAVLGAVAGHSQVSASTAQPSASASVDALHLGAYAAATWGAFELRGGIEGSRLTVDTHRRAGIGALYDATTARYHGRLLQAYAEAAYRFDFGRASVEPYLDLARVHLHTDGYREHGGATALDGAADGADTDYATVGLRAHWALAPQSATAVYAGLGYQQAWGRLDGNGRQRFVAGGDSFQIAGLPLARRTGIADLGLDFRLGRRATVEAGYHGQFGGGGKDQGARLSLKVEL